MKSMMLKDFYNIGHNAKQMMLLIIFLAICLIPSSGAEGFIITCSILCSMMTVTTFSFDERCKWEKYALIMPVSRRDYVKEKYLLNLIFGSVGVAAGLVIGVIIGLVTKKLDVVSLLGCGIVGILITLLNGSLFIPAIFRLGTENVRMIMMAAVALPVLIVFVALKISLYFHVEFTSQLIGTLIAAAAVGILLILFFSYYLSQKWFGDKEF